MKTPSAKTNPALSWNHLILGAIALAAALLVLCGGCTTDYERRVEGLTHKYQTTKMSHEEYMRGVHDAEIWPGKR
jgi:hypothetical protein